MPGTEATTCGCWDGISVWEHIGFVRKLFLFLLGVAGVNKSVLEGCFTCPPSESSSASNRMVPCFVVGFLPDIRPGMFKYLL